MQKIRKKELYAKTAKKKKKKKKLKEKKKKKKKKKRTVDRLTDRKMDMIL